MAIIDYFRSSTVLAIVTVLGCSLYVVGLVVYRIYLSPLANIPGPKLAAATLWYQFYYDVIQAGRYTWKIRELHDIYGPVVRINPYEIHVYDPEFLDVLYTGASHKREKWPWAMNMFGLDSLAGFSTCSHDHHRVRRAALNPYFSKASVYRLEPMIVANVEDLCNRFQEFQRTKEPLVLNHAYSALTTDIISEYCFAKSYGCVNDPNFATQFPDSIDSVSKTCHVNTHFSWLLPIMRMMPLWAVAKMNPDMMKLIEVQADLRRQINPLIVNFDSSAKPAPNYSHPTIFHELLATPMLAPSEKTLPRLADEGQVLLAAGQITTAHHLKTITYHLLAQPLVMGRLLKELETLMPSPSSPIPPMKKLETLPYLTAVLLEGFRISYGIVHRLQRIAPNDDLIYEDGTKTYVIPRGTPVGMTSIHLHDHPSIFPNPRLYDPERWLNRSSAKKGSNISGSENALGEISGVDRSREKYLFNFGKGTRQCLGMNLAYAELILTLAAVFRRFGTKMQLFEVVRERDVDIVHDHFNPYAEFGSKGLRVVIQS